MATRKQRGLAFCITFLNHLISDVLIPYREKVIKTQTQAVQTQDGKNRIQSRKQQLLDKRDKAKAEMGATRDVGSLNLIGRQRAYNAQINYIIAEQKLIEFMAEDFHRDALESIVSDYIEITSEMQKELENWREALLDGNDGVYKELLRQQKGLLTKRELMKAVKVRKYLTDTDYERAKYEEMLQRKSTISDQQEPLVDMLNSLEWKYENSGFHLYLTPIDISDKGRVSGTPVDFFDRRKDKRKDMLHALLMRVQIYFDEIRKEEVLGRLRTRFTSAEELVKAMAESTNPLLVLPNQDPNKEGPYFEQMFIGVKTNKNEAVITNHQLGEALSQIKTNMRAGDDMIFGAHELSNKAVCIMGRTFGNVALPKVQAIVEAGMDYARIGQRRPDLRFDEITLKQIHHVFPAEVHASYLEDRLGEIFESSREFRPEVVRFLEHKEFAEAFALCYILDLITIDKVDHQGETKFRYILKLSNSNPFALTEKPVEQGYRFADTEKGLMAAALNFTQMRDVVNQTRTFTLQLVNQTVEQELMRLNKDPIKQITDSVDLVHDHDKGPFGPNFKFSAPSHRFFTK